jgi:hypothetical protein
MTTEKSNGSLPFSWTQMRYRIGASIVVLILTFALVLVVIVGRAGHHTRAREQFPPRVTAVLPDFGNPDFASATWRRDELPVILTEYKIVSVEYHGIQSPSFLSSEYNECVLVPTSDGLLLPSVLCKFDASWPGYHSMEVDGRVLVALDFGKQRVRWMSSVEPRKGERDLGPAIRRRNRSPDQ